MKQSDYLKVLKLAKRTLEESQNWGEDELYKAPVKNISLPVQPQATELKNNNKLSVEELKNKVLNCKDCALGKTRLNAVFGEGSSSAEIMFVGEGPGFDEDHQGRPFIGKAGQFLTNLIELMGYSRDSVYIANIVKCHPMKDPSNPELRGNDRPPTDLEVSECSKYLEAQIAAINPKVIITLGKPSARYFLKTDMAMGAIRGQFRDYNGIKLMPTYHPSYLIRNGCVFGKKDQGQEVTKLKKEVWTDLKKVMDYLKTGKI
ncbi:uracil-DNA glycosylase [Endomicrobium proavitum]|uniref:Type-4 uracil-DNA glycosylase n=1 Tax=Endomicrobium proavitum TaxID=1408281 RepID=A0A0G3WG08_9BACT|nr:uracil-DNA glycosylase [Endomicrobium proavitum]AKL97556.1 Uracil-DNA glycosylase [Endomicrobium proavitum]